MRKLLSLLLVIALTPVPALFAALPAATTWEVRGGSGVDTNGGCYVSGSTGIDYSQQNAPQFAGSTLATTSTATVVTSSTHTFVANDVGNCIQIATATGWTPGFYSIVSVAAGAATLDRAPAAASVSGGIWAEGGALANIATATSNVTASNVVWATGSFSTTAAIALSIAGPAHATPNTPHTRLLGYGTTRGDNGRFAVTMASGSNYAGINISVAGWTVTNANINCNSLTSSTGFTSNNGSFLRNAKVSNCTASGGSVVLGGTTTQGNNIEITNGTGTYGIVIGNSAGNTRLTHSWIHDNTLTGGAIRVIGPGTIRFNIVSNNPGTNTDGIIISTNTMADVSDNTIYNTGRHGINASVTTFDGGWTHNNLIVGSGGYGYMAASTAGRAADMDIDGNAYYNNALGNRNNADDTTVNPQNAGVYTNTLDVILTANPFTNANTNDFTLNAVAGGGAACRGSATPGVITGLPFQGYMDFGALQVQGVQNITQTACQTSGRAYAQ